jgi:LysR family nitrogen assimilation transcriptional regulator
MDTKLLFRFVKVAELGSVTKAAEAIGMTQPVLSRDLAVLEHEIGAKLLVRQARGVGLTEAGRIFHERASSLLRSFEDLKEAVVSGSQVPCGSLRLGIPISMVHILTSPLIERFNHEYPKVVLTVHDGTSDQMEALFNKDELDIAIFMSAKGSVRNINVKPLVAENMYLVGPANSGLSIRRPVGWSALNDKPMILYSVPNQTRLKVDYAVQQYGLQFHTVAEVSSLALLTDLVERGIGYAITPLGAVQNALNKKCVTAAPLRNVVIRWSLAITRDRPYAKAIPAAERLIRELVAKQKSKNAGWTVL